MTARERRANRRGQPAIALALVLGGWIAARGIVLELPLVSDANGTPLALAKAAAGPARAVAPILVPSAATSAARDEPFGTPPLTPGPRPTMGTVSVEQTPEFSAMPIDSAAGAQLLWLAGVAQTPLPRVVTNRLNIPAQFAANSAASQASRWSGDAWLLLRGGSGGLGAGGGAAPAYGASQIGAVVRYRLAPDNLHALTLYLRGAAALAGAQQQEAAAGLAARPLSRVPVSAQIEARVTHDAAGTHVRPAAMLVSELAPIALPAGFRAETYVQAGYVGGDFATAFVDGQMRIERRIAHIGKAVVAAGGGIWGGAQRDAARLDAGPSASISDGRLRAAADWRFRLTGNAVPKSGPALTVSAGF